MDEWDEETCEEVMEDEYQEELHRIEVMHEAWAQEQAA